MRSVVARSSPNPSLALPTVPHTLVNDIPLPRSQKSAFRSSVLKPPPLLCSYLITDTAWVSVLIISDSLYCYCIHSVGKWNSLMQTFNEMTFCLRPLQACPGSRHREKPCTLPGASLKSVPTCLSSPVSHRHPSQIP